MKAVCLLLFLFFCYGPLFPQINNLNVDKKTSLVDIYGRKVINEDGSRVIYPYSEDIEAEDHHRISYNEASDKNTKADFDFKDDTGLNPVWQYTIMGTSIGRRSLNVLENNGVKEVIMSAQPQGFYGGNQGYWYVMQYNETTKRYDQTWSSRVYDSYISRMIVADLDKDGIDEVLVGFNNGYILIYNSITKKNTAYIKTSLELKINDIQIGDADNDGNNEIAISDNSNIYFYHMDLTLKSQIPQGCFNFRIGNVDGDDALEIVTSAGKVISYNGTNAIIQWTYDTNASYYDFGMIELSDIDNDGMKEVIIAKPWYFIDVLDADIKQLKYQIKADLDINALTLYDVNKDGIDEIFYGDGQWGDINCIDAVTKNLLWKIGNPEHGVTAIEIADLDNNNIPEVIWGGGWTSTGADNLFIACSDKKTISWKSLDIKGPFYAIEVDDIDDDGKNEIVALSYQSNSEYDCSIISVYDADTHLLEWQSDGFFLGSTWMGVYDVAIGDIDKDGPKEIVVAASNAYTGRIWIIDGKTKTIKNNYTYYNPSLNEFYAVNLADLNNDGNLSIIAMTKNQVFEINPTDLTIIWSSESFPGSTIPTIRTGNIDNDEQPEIVVCKDYIFIYDGKTLHKWKSPLGIYSAVDLFDYNNDGIQDVIAGTKNGRIDVFDGSDLNIIFTFQPIDQQIDGIKASRLNDDNNPEIVLTSNGILYFLANGKVTLQTKKLDQVAGKFNSLQIYDTNKDQKQQVFIGTSTKLMEYTSDVYKCMWFTGDVSVSQSRCGIDDGSVELTLSGGIEPYNIMWNTGGTEPILNNLAPGSYSVTVTDQSGCKITRNTTVLRNKLIATIKTSDVSCNNSSNGTAEALISIGSAPYNYQWSNGEENNFISNLKPGTYTVTISDSKNCTYSSTFNIEKDTLLFSVSKTDINCHGKNNGSASAFIHYGTAPYSFQWSNGFSGGSSIISLSPGDYSVKITDSNNCTNTRTFNIAEPAEMNTQITTTTDDPATAFGEGTATINVIGGTPSYFVQWDDPFRQTGIKAINLIAGIYSVTVTDANGCRKTSTTQIDFTSSIDEFKNSSHFKFYPNPSKGFLSLEIEPLGAKKIIIRITDLTGKIVFQEEMIPDERIIKNINLSELESGIYLVTLTLDDVRKSHLFEILK